MNRFVSGFAASRDSNGCAVCHMPHSYPAIYLARSTYAYEAPQVVKYDVYISTAAVHIYLHTEYMYMIRGDIDCIIRK